MCRKHKTKAFNVNICKSFTNVYYTMLTAETQAKTAGFTLLSGLVWGINILTIIYNIYLRNTWIIDRVGGFPLVPETPLRLKMV